MNRRSAIFLALGLACGAGLLGMLRWQHLEEERLEKEAEAAADLQPNYVDPFTTQQKRVATQNQQLQQQTTQMLQQMIGALQGQNDPNDVPFGPQAEEPEKPFSSKVRVAYAFFVLSHEEAEAAMAKANPEGNRRTRLVTHGLYVNLSKPGASGSFVVKVGGMDDPGPGLNAILGGNGLDPSFPPLYSSPEFYSTTDARDHLADLTASVKEIGGDEQVAQRAVLWRLKHLDPTAAGRIGEVPPPGEALTHVQRETAKSTGFAAEQHLVGTLRAALEQATKENKTVLAVKVVG